MMEAWYKMKKIIADKKRYYIAYNEDKSIVQSNEFNAKLQALKKDIETEKSITNTKIKNLQKSNYVDEL